MAKEGLQVIRNRCEKQMPKHPFKLGPKEQLPLQLLGISHVSDMDGATDGQNLKKMFASFI